MWNILQNDMSQCITELSDSLHDWKQLALDMVAVAAMNQRLQRLASGAKLNKAEHLAALLVSVQSLLEQNAKLQQRLPDNQQQLLDQMIGLLQGFIDSDNPGEHYAEQQQQYAQLDQQLGNCLEQDAATDGDPDTANTHRVDSSAPSTETPSTAEASSSQPLSIEPAVVESASPVVKIFLQELDEKTHTLVDGLLQVEKGQAGLKDYEALMRCAHSLKGGARLAGLDPLVGLAHRIEDIFSTAQQGRRGFCSEDIDLLIQVVELLPELAQLSIGTADAGLITARLADGEAMLQQLSDGQQSDNLSVADSETQPDRPESKVSAVFEDENLQNIIRMVSDMKIDSRLLLDMSKDFRQFYKRMSLMSHQLANVGGQELSDAESLNWMNDFRHQFDELVRQGAELFDQHDRIAIKNTNDLKRLSLEALSCRMGVFADCLVGVPRLVRDLAKKQNKLVELVIEGERTPVDRDIIKPFIPALTHLVQNAIDHGIGTPKHRLERGRPKEGTLRLSAEHRSGYLIVTIEDDGAGINLDQVRQKVVADGMVNQEMVEQLSDEELLSFIFLPRFTLKQEVTMVSGRGVGLDIVNEFIAQAQGKVKINSQRGKGTSFEFRLPVSLSTIRCVIIEIAAQIYAIPVYQMDRVIPLHRDQVYYIEGRPVVSDNGEDIHLFHGAKLLELQELTDQLPEKMVIFKSTQGSFGLMVDRVLEEIELIDRPLHAGLGKLRDVRTASAMPDGTPVLILDAEDLVTSMEKQLFDAAGPSWDSPTESGSGRKRVLVVDDSLTVREVERNMLAAGGYEVDAAVDGVDGWNHLRQGRYDLLVTDIDMPRMNGWELLEKVRSSANMQNLPVIIVSYKDRPEDFERGLESGADSYVTKGSFQDDSFMQTVKKLIGGGD